MRFKKLTHILVATAITMLLHTGEEYMTGLWNFDRFIIVFSRYLSISPVGVYLVIQVLVLLLIAILLVLLFRKRFNKFLGIILGMVFILEMTHLYDSLRVGGYYPGLYTGLTLVVIGFFYWREFIRNYKNL